jgi:hypothetical protein
VAASSAVDTAAAVAFHAIEPDVAPATVTVNDPPVPLCEIVCTSLVPGT